MYVMKISHSYRYLCPCEAVDKIFLVVKVKSEYVYNEYHWKGRNYKGQHAPEIV